MYATFANSAPAARASLVLLWMAVVWASSWAGIPAGLRACLVIPVLFYCPGWLLLRALRIELHGIEALLFSIALSWTLIIACGFALHPFGALSEMGWLMATGGVMVALAVVAPVGMAKRRPLVNTVARMDVLAVAGFAVASVLTIGSIELAAWQARNDRPFEILELWMTTGDSPGEVQVGFRNGDLQERTVRLEVRGEQGLIDAEAPMVLAPGQTVTRIFTISPMAAHAPERIEALLFDKENRILRRTHVTVGSLPDTSRVQKEPDE